MPILLILLFWQPILLANCSLHLGPYFAQNFASKFGQGLGTACQECCLPGWSRSTWGQICVSQPVLPSLVHGTRLMDYIWTTLDHISKTYYSRLLAACKKGCCSCCKCKKATCIALSWCEATGQRNNSCITILHIMYHNWTNYALYNWSNITRWNAWLCGASLREQHAAGGRRNMYSIE